MNTVLKALTLKWTAETTFELSAEKTKGEKINKNFDSKNIGMIFDSKLSWCNI